MKKAVNVLVLHELVDVTINNSFESVNVEVFEKLLQLTEGRTGTSVDEEKCDFVITFDDGYKSDIIIALPLLQKYKAKAVFFISVENIGLSGFMNWNDVKLIHESGMEIGSHSLSHPNFKLLSSEEIEFELRESKRRIEKEINCEIKSFAFPYGAYSNYSVHLAKKIGFDYIYCSDHGLNVSGNKKLLYRNSINGHTSLASLSKILFPTIKRRILWFTEDFVKYFFKVILGNYYIKLRNSLWR
jgi:peptidoglycan/xylan/chitin deacetylase (PgdA/CDA1 family)